MKMSSRLTKRSSPSHYYVYNSNSNQDNGCLIDGYWQIYFGLNASAEDIYRISTPWTLSYPGKMTSALENASLYVYPSNPVASCGWIHLGDGYISGINTGTVYYQILKQGVTYDPTVFESGLNVLNSQYPSEEVGLAVGIPCGFAALVLLLCCLFCCRND